MDILYSLLTIATSNIIDVFVFFFPPLIFISWRLTTLQYCSGFCQ